MKVMGQVPTKDDAVVLTVLHALTATNANPVDCMTRGDIRATLKDIGLPMSKGAVKEALRYLVKNGYVKTKHPKGCPRVYACKHSPKKCDEFHNLINAVLSHDEIGIILSQVLPQRQPQVMFVEIDPSQLFGGFNPFQ